MKKVRIVIVIVVAGIIGVLIIRAISSVRETLNEPHYDLPTSKTIAKEDSSLIAQQYWHKLHVDETYNSKVRNPVSFLIYENAYELIIGRIDLEKEETFNDLIIIENKSVTSSAYYTYNNIEHNHYFNFKYLVGPINPANHLYLTLSGDSISVIRKTDSLISYHLICKNVSIRYAEDAPKDFFFIGKEGFLNITKRVPLNISLLRKGKAVFFLLLAPHTSKGTVPADLLDKMLE